MSNRKATKFWAIIKINGTVEMHCEPDGKIKCFLSERDADIEAEQMAMDSSGKISCLVVESKNFHKYRPIVEKIITQVSEADQVRIEKTVDIRAALKIVECEHDSDVSND